MGHRVALEPKKSAQSISFEKSNAESYPFPFAIPIRVSYRPLVDVQISVSFHFKSPENDFIMAIEETARHIRLLKVAH